MQLVNEKTISVSSFRTAEPVFPSKHDIWHNTLEISNHLKHPDVLHPESPGILFFNQTIWLLQPDVLLFPTRRFVNPD